MYRQSDESSEEEEEEEEEGPREEQWLSSRLLVKMVDRLYKKGRYYNTKVC